MDVGPHPKLALLLSLTLMNLVAVGICVYAPSPINERKFSQDSKKRANIRKRAPSLNDEIKVEVDADGANTVKITAEENQLKNETESIIVTQKPPAIENSELGVENEPINTLNTLEKSSKNLNVITLNENFGNDSSKEGSDASLTDMCGLGAELAYTPQDLAKNVTAVITKSFQLIDTFNTKVVPAVENFNDKIAKTVRLEKNMDFSVVEAINTSICPAVIRMSDSINRMHEKINRVTENINRANEPKERSVSCQVSESLLVKSVRRKNSFFSPISPTSEAQIINLFGHMSCRIFSKRKDKPYFKTSTVQYWANRKRALVRKFRKIRSKENLQLIKTTEENSTQQKIAVESSSNFSDLNQQLRTFERMSSKEVLREEDVAKGSPMLGDFCHDAEEVVGVKSKETVEIKVEMNRSKEDQEKIAQQEPILPSTSHLSVGERVSSLLSQLPSYLSSSDEFCGQRSTSNVEETSQTFQVHFFNNDLNRESKEHLKYGDESRDPPDSVFVTGSSNERDFSGVDASEANTISDANKSLQLPASVQNTVEQICGPLNNRRELQDVLNLLDPNLERNTVENLFLLILKVFDAWSESQLTIVPSRALSRLSPSESTCMNSTPMRSKSVDPSEECLNRISGPANYYSCIDIIKSEDIKQLCESSDICEKEEGSMTGELKHQGVAEETLSTTPKCINTEMSMCGQFQETCNAAITNGAEIRLKAIVYKEQYSIARKIAAECIETAISTSDIDNDCMHPSDTGLNETMKRKKWKIEETDDSELVTSRISSEESFYSWVPESSSDDYSYHECDGSLGSWDASDKCLKKRSFDRLNLSKRNLIREQEKFLPNRHEVKDSRSEAQCSNAYNVSRPGSAVVLKASSIESWMLNSTSGDGVEIRNSRSELKSEEMSDISSRPISFTTEDTSDGESNHSLLETTASESSKDVQIRKQWSSRIFNKTKKKRPKTPKTAVAAAEAPSHAQSDYAIKVAESFISRNTSLSDEN